MDRREAEVLQKRMNVLAQSFIAEIIKFYSDKGIKPDIYGLMHVPNAILLLDGDRVKVKELLSTSPQATTMLELLTYMDSILPNYQKKGDPITEIMLMVALIRVTSNLMLPFYIQGGTNVAN